MSFVEKYVTKETAKKARFEFSRPTSSWQSNQGDKQFIVYPGLIWGEHPNYHHMNIVEVISNTSGRREIHFGTMVGQKYTKDSITPQYKQYADRLLKRESRIAGRDLEKAILAALEGCRPPEALF